MSKQMQHLYPLKIALRAQKLIQGSVFYGAFTDLATGQYVRVIPGATEKIKALMLESGLSDENYETSWEYFVVYMNEFKHPIFQHGIYSMISHWDWYISNLGRFVNFVINDTNLNKIKKTSLLKLNCKPFREQINILKSAVGIDFAFKPNTIVLIEEMNLVRNLGMHNEWEVDDDYLKKTSNANWEIGQKRDFQTEEMNEWHAALLDVITITAHHVATRYSQIPHYE